MERRTERASAPAVVAPTSGTVVDARMSLALWLRAGRSQRGMSLDDVARVTKIQVRILERIEAGKLDGLPADVFVRGFVRSFARCVGLNEDEALRRYRDAASQPSSTARALVESMSELAPVTARSSSVRLPVAPVAPVESAPVEAVASVPTAPVEAVASESAQPVEPSSASSAASASPARSTTTSQGKRKKNRGKNRKRKAMATGTPASATPVVEASADPVEATPSEPVVEASADPVEASADPVEASVDPVVEASADPVVEASADPVAEATPSVPVAATSEPCEAAPVTSAEPWTPTMPTVVAPTVPWRRPAHAVAPAASARMVPSLVIDDADPELAEREREDRAAAKEPTRRLFLPPILLDREDRSARQGGLTLAVIILLIAATLTLSYLMRRPSSSGDGVTQVPSAAHVEPELRA